MVAELEPLDATRLPEAGSPLRAVEAGVDTRYDCRGRGFAPLGSRGLGR